jgi:hypothetical protein
MTAAFRSAGYVMFLPVHRPPLVLIYFESQAATTLTEGGTIIVKMVAARIHFMLRVFYAGSRGAMPGAMMQDPAEARFRGEIRTLGKAEKQHQLKGRGAGHL